MGGRFDPRPPMERDETAPPIELPSDSVYLIDTNELIPQHRGYQLEPAAKVNLPVGDYSIRVGAMDCNHLVVVERKSLPNILGEITVGRRRWEDCLARMQDEVRSPHVVIEATWDRLSRGGWQHTRVAPAAVQGSIVAWMSRFRVCWHFLPARSDAIRFTRWILTRVALDVAGATV